LFTKFTSTFASTIMTKRRKNTTFLFFILLTLIVGLPSTSFAGSTKIDVQVTDTIPQKNVKPLNSNINKKLDSANAAANENQTTIDTFKIQYSKDSLAAPVDREAADSAVFFIKDKLFLLYGSAKTKYEENDINANFIKLDQKNETLFARGTLDSSGLVTEQLTLKTTDQNITADSILYNTKSGKALTHNSRTSTDEMYVQTQKAKLLGDKKSFYGYENRFTTCNYDEPHFCFHAKKIKVVANDIAVSGFANPEFEGVPLPIGIPFGIFPMRKGKKGGVLPPQFTANEDYGIGLEGLGYYFTFKKNGRPSDYWDLILRSNIYSYGSWNLIATPSYRKRYKYNGTINVNVQNTRQNFKGDADFIKNKSFSVAWQHSADTRSRPGVSFSSNVNFQKSGFNKYNANNPRLNITNIITSSVAWSKTWQQKMFGEENTFNLTTNTGLSQNTNLNLVTLNAPEINFSMQTFYPFVPKNKVGAQKWYEKIGIGYNGSLRGKMDFFDNQPLAKIIKTIRDTFMWGASHNIPISLSLPSLGPIQASPSISYNEYTYGQKTFFNWNPLTKTVDTTINKGVFQARTMNFGFNLATAIFGTYSFKTKNQLKARHVIRPTVGIAYQPDMNKRFNKRVQLDTTMRFLDYNVFNYGNLYQGLPSNSFGGLNFGIDQNLEIKTTSKTDSTETGIKRVRIIDGFSINSGYNFLIDSFQLQPFSLSLRSTFMEGKINITAGANIDPYKTNAVGDKINKYAWQGRKFGIGSFGNLTNANISLSTQLRGGDKKKDTKNNTNDRNNPNFQGNSNTPDMSLEEQMRLNEYINSNPAEFVDFNIPWDLSLSGTVNYTRQLQPDFSYKSYFNASANFNGNFSLTQKWKCGASGFYDFNTGRIQQIQMFITREMHCWQMAINVTPVGSFRSFNISISPKAGILRDLKINRTRVFYGE
jgi:LPS-assembly protein